MKRAVFIFILVFAFCSILLATDAFGLSHNLADRGVWEFRSEPTFLMVFGAALMLAGMMLAGKLAKP